MRLIVLIIFLFNTFFVFAQQKQVITEEKTFIGFLTKRVSPIVLELG